MTLVHGRLRVTFLWTRRHISSATIDRGFSFGASHAGALALAFSAFGITGVGAAKLFAYPYWCIEKGYARAAGHAPKTRVGGQAARLDSRHADSTPGSA